MQQIRQLHPGSSATPRHTPITSTDSRLLSVQAVLVDIEGSVKTSTCFVTTSHCVAGVLMDPDSAATSAAIVDVFGRREVEVTSDEALTKPCSTECSDNHQLRNELRAVMNAVAGKWQAAKGAAPTEWDLEAMWKELPQVHRPSITSPRLNHDLWYPGSFRSNEDCTSRGWSR